MQTRTWVALGLILIVAVVASWIALPNNPGIHIKSSRLTIDRDLDYQRGLDLQGGLQVVLAAALPEGQEADRDTMQAARQIVENRVNGLGVSEPLIQLVGNDRIVVELPGLSDPDEAIRTFGETGLLEFIDAGTTPLGEGTTVVTDFGTTAAPTDTTGTVYHTVLTGADLQAADVAFDPNTGQPQIAFEFKGGHPAQTLSDYTSQNVGRYLAITLDKEVISSPVIQSPITDGRGVINGRFSLEEAQALVIQLKYGALPIPLEVIQNRTVGATLGEDSVQRSLIGGLIGIIVVALFMILYYRLPGLLAVLALGIYMALVLALFKLIPVTLTLAGIAGFVLSVGIAVDANILIFERMKEELREEKSLPAALRVGFERAWPSIRDSNASTLITCAILFWFGATFGASIVKGFALTLALGVLVSLFTAITVTRTFLRTVVNTGRVQNRWWFGV